MAKKTGRGRDGERDALTLSERSATDPRVALSRERVLAATLELLTETGLGGVTIDDISKRSGVAKTTIYRHWPDRSAIVIDACLRMTDGDEEPPDTGSLEGDVRAILTDLAGMLKDPMAEAQRLERIAVALEVYANGIAKASTAPSAAKVTAASISTDRAVAHWSRSRPAPWCASSCRSSASTAAAAGSSRSSTTTGR